MSQTAITLEAWNQTHVSYQALHSSAYTVFIFLSPECPLCENYSATLKTLRAQFPEEEVSFVGIFSGQWYSRDEIQHFLARYQPPVKVVLDPRYQLQALFQATVTPEAVVVNRSGKVEYQGKIDNWIVSLGKKRTVVNQLYLQDALAALLKGEEPAIRQTEAVGCFIE
ncbi:MAG: redoxin domain-containing protein [Bacteroidia bacterium]|nr:redoxin domain-containing protein [Bacteroidia bacterium]